jgi:hypothetical protein
MFERRSGNVSSSSSQKERVKDGAQNNITGFVEYGLAQKVG